MTARSGDHPTGRKHPTRHMEANALMVRRKALVGPDRDAEPGANDVRGASAWTIHEV